MAGKTREAISDQLFGLSVLQLYQIIDSDIKHIAYAEMILMMIVLILVVIMVIDKTMDFLTDFVAHTF